MADKGFRIEKDIEKLGLRLNIPPFAPASGQMKSADVSMTEKVAIHRVHVERAIARVKKFKILDNRMDLSLFSSINQIWFCVLFPHKLYAISNSGLIKISTVIWELIFLH